MPPDLAVLSTLIGSNYPCLELMFMVPRVFESLKFDSISVLPFINEVSFISLTLTVCVGYINIFSSVALATRISGQVIVILSP